MDLGGFFELEINQLKEYHTDAIRLNTGRNALEYILKCRGYKKLFIPLYTCDAILEPLIKLNVTYEFYEIDRKLEPIFNYKIIGKNEGFLYTNYFGLKSHFIARLVKCTKNLIVDNAQSFFSKPIHGIDAFYSARKFFGVPDGAYVYTSSTKNSDFEIDFSYDRFAHLLMRTDNNINEGYSEFKKNELKLVGNPIRKMSNLSHKLLKGIDYNRVAKKRIENFHYLHKSLKYTNEFIFEENTNAIPMVYPYLTAQKGIREFLINKRIYTPQYWPNVLEWAVKDSWEYQLASNLVFLPIDQRYDINDMEHIINILNI